MRLSLPDGATPEQHIRMTRLIVRGAMGFTLAAFTAIVLIGLVFYLPEDPSAALTALIGGVAGYLGASLKDVIAALAENPEGD